MKDYKKLAPILIVFFTFIAIYSRISEASDKETEYYGYLEAARNYREGKIYVDAIVEYENALNMRNTIELCKEIGDMYLEKGDSSDIDYWADYLTETYPLEAYSYEYLMDYYMSLEKYDKCFELYDEVVARGITSDEIESEILGIRYEYTLGYKSYDYVSEFSNDKCVVYDLAKGLYGYQSTTDNKVINPRYVQAGAFNNIMAPIQDAEGEFYFVDSEGNRKLNVPKDIEITKVGYIQNDRYPVGTEGTMYFADMDGNLILGPYEDATACNGGISAVKENGYWYMIDMDGNKLSEAMLGFATDVK
jgi:pentatricopeptide repeat protein